MPSELVTTCVQAKQISQQKKTLEKATVNFLSKALDSAYSIFVAVPTVESTVAIA